MKKTLLSTISIILVMNPHSAWAAFDDDLANATSQNVYSIKSTCNSSGQFTARALEQTRTLRGVIEKLKNNAACTGMRDSMETSLKSLAENLQTMQASKQMLESEVPQLPLTAASGEMQALRSFAFNFPAGGGSAPSFLGPSVMAALSKSAMKMQRIDVVAQGTPDLVGDPKKTLTQKQALQILKSKNDYRAASMSGLHLVNSTMDSVMKAQEGCLDDNMAAHIGTGMTQMLASFITGSETTMTSSAAASALNKIVTYVSRDKKYIDAIRKLNKVEFQSTLSCLIEMTTEGYCEAQDAQVLLTEVKKDFNFVEKTIVPSEEEKRLGAQTRKVVEAEPKNFKGLISKGPMAGHYLLGNQIPIITDWINKIQFGVEPQLPTEAQFQVDAFKTGLQPFITMKEILGNYNAKMAQLKNPSTSLAAKQNLALEMLFIFSDGFTRGGGPNNAVENFFTRVHPDNRMPFALLGIPYESMPDEVFTAKNNMTMAPDQYIRLNFQTRMPQFKDPEALVIAIKLNAEDIFKKANYLAEQYFMQFFIPDEVAVVTESMVGMNRGDVRTSLAHVDLYVKDFIERMSAEGGDPAMINIALDLRMRFGKIFARYKQMNEFGLQQVMARKLGNINEKEFKEKMEGITRDFIQDVYDLFNIKKMRAAWLQNRLMIIIKKDYSMAMQKREFSNKYLQDLLLATGLESLNQLFGLAGINFNTAAVDLAQARDIYWKNLQALQQISQAPMQNYINEFRLRADPNIIDQRDLWKEANKYAYNRFAEKTPTNTTSYQWWLSAKGAINNLGEGLFAGFGFFGKDVEYGWPKGVTQELFNTERPDLTDTTDGGSQKLWAKNCLVILGFNDLSPYWYLCKNATFFSEFYDEAKYKNQPNVLSFLKNFLSTPFAATAYTQLDPNDKRPSKDKLNLNRQARICALRDHYRKNYVMQLTAGLQRDNEVYENEYTQILERPKLEIPIPESQKQKPPTQDEDTITFPQDKPQTGSKRKQGQSSRTAESQSGQKEKASQKN